jgi:hypothetical protein
MYWNGERRAREPTDHQGDRAEQAGVEHHLADDHAVRGGRDDVQQGVGDHVAHHHHVEQRRAGVVETDPRVVALPEREVPGLVGEQAVQREVALGPDGLAEQGPVVHQDGERRAHRDQGEQRPGRDRACRSDVVGGRRVVEVGGGRRLGHRTSRVVVRRGRGPAATGPEPSGDSRGDGSTERRAA